MKFYDCTTAPSPRRVRIFLAEKGIELDTVQVDLGSGEQLGDAFRKVNPDCVVPALELDDGTCLSEVIAICQYLEELYPEPRLLGTSSLERAQVSMWNAKVEQLGLMSMMDAFRNSAKGLVGRALPGPESYAQIPELAERGRQRVLQFFSRLDDQLADNWVKLPVPEGAKHVSRWYAEVSKRPSAAA